MPINLGLTCIKSTRRTSSRIGIHVRELIRSTAAKRASQHRLAGPGQRFLCWSPENSWMNAMGGAPLGLLVVEPDAAGFQVTHARLLYDGDG